VQAMDFRGASRGDRQNLGSPHSKIIWQNPDLATSRKFSTAIRPIVRSVVSRKRGAWQNYCAPPSKMSMAAAQGGSNPTKIAASVKCVA
jgi:hypothetical protein